MLLTASSFAAISAVTLPAFAEPNEPPGGLETIIVTAQKRSEKLQDVPIAVTALSSSQLEAAAVDRADQLQALTPNVGMISNANFIAPYIRGVGTQFANPGLEPSVGMYLDDVYLARASSGFFSFSDIAQVEVLKGPQGILYGRNTTGGAIRVITKDPTPEFHAGIGFTAGNYGKLGGDGYVSGTILPGLTGRLAFQYNHNDGIVDNIVTPSRPMQSRDLKTFRGKLNWQVNDQLKIKLAADYTDKHDDEGSAFLPLFNQLPEQTGLALGGITDPANQKFSGNVPNAVSGDSFNLKMGGAELRVDYELQGFTLSSITGLRYDDFNGLADLDFTSAPFYNGNTRSEYSHDFSQEFQAVSDGSGKFNWVGGVFYWHETAGHDFGISGLVADAGVPVLLNGVAPSFVLSPLSAGEGYFLGGDGKVDVDSIAPYGQVSYKFLPHWELTLGARYTVETKKLKYNDFYVTTVNALSTLVNPGNPLFVLPAPTDEETGKEFTPKILMTWRPTDKIMLYAGYTKGFKGGGFNLPNPAPGPVPKVQNETLQSVEVGWKTEFGPVRFNGAYFHYEAKNLQVQITDTSGVTAVRNAASATTDGVEGDLTVAVNERLELGGGFGWQDAKFDSFPNGQVLIGCASATQLGLVDSSGSCAQLGGLGLATVVADLKGKKLPLAPDLTGYIRAAYNQPLPESLGTVTATFVYSYSDSFSWTTDNLYNEPAKWLLNATLGWKSEDGHLGVSAYGTNLTDQVYNTYKTAFGPTGADRVPGLPRQYGVRLSYDY